MSTTASLPWPAELPEAVGLNQDILNDDLMELLGAHKTNAAALAVNGKLVWERYWNGHGPTSRFNVFSIAKCYASACIGLLVDDGKLTVDDPACAYLPEWAHDGRREITIRHLLTMTSGLQLDYARFGAETDFTAAALNWPLSHPPGTQCCYEQATAQALSPIIKRVSGRQPLDFIRERLLDPIGARETGWAATPAGDSLTWRSVLVSARDLTRFGQLLLQDGQWNGRQLLSADYIRKATARDPLLMQIPSCPSEKAWRRENWGWMFFNNEGGLVPSARSDAFSLGGAYGNMCLVDRERNFVFTRLVTPEGLSDYSPYDNALGGTHSGAPKFWELLAKAFQK